MSKNPLANPDELYSYIKSVSLRETSEQQELRKRTGELAEAAMQISPDQGQFMAMLVHLIGARKIVEVGTFTGYSALTMAMALPEDGRLVACDISHEWTNIGKLFWKKAGVDKKIDLRIGPALDTLDSLISEGWKNETDLVFIDADKTNYEHYYERGLTLIGSNGLIVVDNVFWSGAVIESEDQSDDTVSIRNLNEKISKDQRVDISMISVGDGLFLARKK